MMSVGVDLAKESNIGATELITSWSLSRAIDPLTDLSMLWDKYLA